MTSHAASLLIKTHDFSLIRRALPMLRLWQDRMRARRALALWSERDLHDIGLSWSTVAEEVNKPFWRA